MKKTTIVIISLVSLISWSIQAQNKYNELDKASLRAFLRQPSSVQGKCNAERIGLLPADTMNWGTEETWIAKLSSANEGTTPIAGDESFRWSNDPIKQLVEIQFPTKKLAGNLNVSGCEALEEIDCYQNQIQTLNTSGCKKLTELDCGINALTNLDISGCTSLLFLFCYENLLSDLSISDCKNLTVLSCNNNLLTTLNLSSCVALIEVSCARNLLTAIDITKNIALKRYSCSGNKIGDIDISKCPELKTLECDGNKLTHLDISHCPSLEVLFCYDNQLKLSTLPLRTDRMITYECDPQDTIYSDNIPSESIIDLSSEYLSGKTTYTWYDISNGNEVELTSGIINNNNGTFQLSKTLNGNKLRCKITNPDYQTNYNIKLITIVRDYKISGNPTDIINLSPESASIFLNPIENELCISGKNNITDITIFDMNGRMIYHNNKLNTGTFILPITGWAKGIYVVNVRNKQATQAFKIIKN